MMRLEVAIVLGLCLGVVNTQRALDAASHDKNSDSPLIAFGVDSGKTMDFRMPMPPKHGQPPEICDQGISGRKGTSSPDVYWPDGVLPFEFHESIENDVASYEKMLMVFGAMAHWSNQTCISFRPRQPTDRSFLIFRSDSKKCSSWIGIHTWNSTGQNVNLGSGCWDVKTIAHEIGHAVGFHHEQARADRDEHVEIIWPNVDVNQTHNFILANDVNHSVPYDLTSVMQYPYWAFSIDEFDKSTIVTKDPFLQRLLFNLNLLSFRDRRLANLMYGCTDETSKACRNGGYLRKTARGDTAGEYSCDCPPNTRGEFCMKKIRDSYYEELPCGGNVTREGVIETPGYPEHTQKDISCAWRILAPTGHRVELTIKNFKFWPRNNEPDSKRHNKCVEESVEFRLDASNEYQGSFYCGNDLERGDLLASKGNRTVIIVNAKAGSNLRARVSFVPHIEG